MVLTLVVCKTHRKSKKGNIAKLLISLEPEFELRNSEFELRNFRFEFVSHFQTNMGNFNTIFKLIEYVVTTHSLKKGQGIE